MNFWHLKKKKNFPNVTRYYDNEILLNINMKCWNLTFNAQGLKVIIVVIQVGSVKIFVIVVEAFKKIKEISSVYHQN